MKRLAGIAAMVMMLAACGRQSDGQGAKAAGGEVVAGTISDAMLDTSTSQAEAPLMPVQAEKAPGSMPRADASDAGAEDDDAAAPAIATDAPKPVESPKPATTPNPATTPRPTGAAAKPAP